MTKNKRGGARKGAGRKPINDKKKPVTIFVKESTITLHGIDNLKTKLYATIDGIYTRSGE